MNWPQVFKNLIAIALYVFIALVVYYIYKYIRSGRKKRQLDYKFVVVTGGSSGIGKEIAIAAARRGAHVAIIARNINKLDEAQKAIRHVRKYGEKQKVACVSLDITAHHSAVEKILNEMEEKVGPIYMLVNCAGYAICHKFEDTPIEELEKMININFMATYYCTKAVIPKMKKENEGSIVFVSSHAGLTGVFGYSAYSATKFALRGLAESLAMELSAYNISVTLCSPPDTDTPGFAIEEKSKLQETKLIAQTAGLEKPQKVAEALINDALTGKFFSTTGLEGHILTTLCAGMAPYTSVTQLLFQAILMGPLRIISAFYLFSFHRIIVRCMKNREQHKKSE